MENQIKPPINQTEEEERKKLQNKKLRTLFLSFSSALARLASSLALALSDFSLEAGSSVEGGAAGAAASCFLLIDRFIELFLAIKA